MISSSVGLLNASLPAHPWVPMRVYHLVPHATSPLFPDSQPHPREASVLFKFLHWISMFSSHAPLNPHSLLCGLAPPYL